MSGVSRPSSGRGPARAVHVLERVARPATKAAAAVGAVAILALAVNVALDVGLRVLANQPIDGTIEYVTYWWMVPMVFFGFAVAEREREHPDLPVIYERLTGAARPLLAVLGKALTVIFAGLIGWYGMESALHQMTVQEYAGASGVSIWPVRFAVPLGILAFLLELVISTLKESTPEANPIESPTGQADV